MQGNLCDRPGSQYFYLHKSFVSDTDNPLIDEDGHGTMVAGIIGARGNNAGDYYTTAVGVCWDVSMVSLKVSEYDEDEDDFVSPVSRVIQAINYANQVGIDVLNYSMGSYNVGSQLVGFKEAIQNYAGVFVCAAGNDGLNTDTYPHYPSSIELPNLISVAACTYGDSIRYNSNCGRVSVDLFAPGENIYTCNNDGGYTHASDTSFATPFVSGTAILLKIANPGLTAFEIKDIILQSVDQRDNYICTSDGRLNVYKAMLRALKDTDLLETTDHICNIVYDNKSTTQHDIFCDSCNFSYTDAHTLINTPGTVSCSNCNYIQSHTSCYYSYIVLDPSYHMAVCEACDNSYTETHIWYSVEPGVYMCYMCDYNGS